MIYSCKVSDRLAFFQKKKNEPIETEVDYSKSGMIKPNLLEKNQGFIIFLYY